jgi:hypothetical protein
MLSANYWEHLTREVLEKKLEQDIPWGYKEPRMSFLLGYHVDILRDLGVEPFVLWARRPLHRVASSVHMRREGWEDLWAAIGGVALRDYVLERTLLSMLVPYEQFWFYEGGGAKVREPIPEYKVVSWIATSLTREALEYDHASVSAYLAKEEECRTTTSSEPTTQLVQ